MPLLRADEAPKATHTTKATARSPLGGLRAFAALAWLLAGCSREVAHERAPCPRGTTDRPAVSDAIVGLLVSTREGSELLAATERSRGRLCFGPQELSVVSDSSSLVLSDALSVPEAAARVGHLLVHVRDGLPYRDGDGAQAGSCEEIADRALAREAPAYALELRLRRELRVEGPVMAFDFERDYWAAPEAERDALILGWLRAHPLGGPGVDALGDGYRARCEAERR